jgi:hypothetical protein
MVTSSEVPRFIRPYVQCQPPDEPPPFNPIESINEHCSCDVLTQNCQSKACRNQAFLVARTQMEIVLHTVSHRHDSEDDMPDSYHHILASRFPFAAPYREQTYELLKGSFRNILLDTSPAVHSMLALALTLWVVSRRIWLFSPCGRHFWRLQDPVLLCQALFVLSNSIL